MSCLYCSPHLQCLPPASLCGQPSWVGPCYASRCPSCSSVLWCRPKATVDTQNILESCTVSLALGPVSLSPFLKNQLTSKCPWLTWEWDHFFTCSPCDVILACLVGKWGGRLRRKGPLSCGHLEPNPVGSPGNKGRHTAPSTFIWGTWRIYPSAPVSPDCRLPLRGVNFSPLSRHSGLSGWREPSGTDSPFLLAGSLVDILRNGGHWGEMGRLPWNFHKERSWIPGNTRLHPSGQILPSCLPSYLLPSSPDISWALTLLSTLRV